MTSRRTAKDNAERIILVGSLSLISALIIAWASS